MAVVRNLAANSAFSGPDQPRKGTRVLGQVFGATGITPVAIVEKGSITVAGTFVGTVSFERQDSAGNWIVVQSFTAPGQSTLDDNAMRPTRFNCSAWTSGAISCELRA